MTFGTNYKPRQGLLSAALMERLTTPPSSSLHRQSFAAQLADALMREQRRPTWHSMLSLVTTPTHQICVDLNRERNYAAASRRFVDALMRCGYLVEKPTETNWLMGSLVSTKDMLVILKAAVDKDDVISVTDLEMREVHIVKNGETRVVKGH